MIEAGISYRKVRNVAELLNAAVNYIKLHLKSIVGSILTIPLPFLVVSGLLSYFFKNTQMNLLNSITVVSGIDGDNLAETISIILFYLAGLTLQSIIINKHILTNETLTEEEKLTTKTIRTGIVEDFRKQFLNVFLLTVYLIIASLAIGAFLTTVISLNMNDLSGDPFSLIVQVLFIAAFVLWFVPMVIYFIIASLFVCQRDDLGIFQGAKKVWRYTTENKLRVWGSTLLSLLISYLFNLILSIPIALAFIIPAYFSTGSIYTSASSIMPAVMAILGLVSTFFTLCSSSIFQIITVFEYANFEEQKEGLGLQEKINNI